MSGHPIPLALALAATVAAPAAAQDFACRNKATEIRCIDGGCEFAEDGAFTPMILSRRGTMLEICAYSGCWSGPVLIRRSRAGMDILYAEVRNADQPDSPVPEALAVIWDGGSRTAQMRWGSFANVMTCDA
jgi:hypothetical protein